MTYLFIFAHPDDETVACAATMKQLVDAGEKVILVSATDGSGGEVMEKAKKDLAKHGSLGKLRRHELQQVADLLGVTEVRILDFTDGEITNKHVWVELKQEFIELINQYKPDVVVTFDHSGWYFHLDHVGVSIAVTLAFQEAQHQAEALLHVYMKVNTARQKWKYVFPESLPITHVVDGSTLREFKLQVLAAHASQDIDAIIQKVTEEKDHKEVYQLVMGTEKGKKLLAEHQIFKMSG